MMLFERATDEDVRIVQGGIWQPHLAHAKDVNEVETARPWPSKTVERKETFSSLLQSYKKDSFEEAGGQNFQEICSTTDCTFPQ